MEQGFPVEFLLLFTVLIWIMYFLVYVSSPKNKVNQWCCICGLLLSIGVLKEYIYMSGMLADIRIELFGMTYWMDEFLNSVLTAVLYYLSMPCVVILSMYFCHVDKKAPRCFCVLRILVFLPAVIFALVYPINRTREIPVADPRAFQIVAVYNLVYGVLATAPILITLVRERQSYLFRQRRLVSVIGLLPLWYWLITLFLFHLLELEHLYKLWQGNAFILLFLFLYYVRHLFREGIWGLRLNREYFEWSEEPAALTNNTMYMVHMLKGETAKISWCIQSLREMGVPETEEMLDIIQRSVGHVEEFARRSGLYAKDLKLNLSRVDMKSLFQEIAQECCQEWKGKVTVEVDEKNRFLYCDYHHMKEALRNLAENAVEAMGDEGTLTLSFHVPGKHVALIRVADTGPGIAPEDAARIFEPYYTKNPDSRHMGLGLSYCRKVAAAHRGYIQTAPAKKGTGTEFTLCLPLGHRMKKPGPRDASGH